jgi:predicted Zn-dependent protease
MNTPYNNYRYNQVHKSESKLELTIEQAFQQAVNAHNGGKEQDAERLYRAILQSQPLHPDANHNLGVLAVSLDETDAALLLFKTALKANPEIEKFCFSYINALVKNNELKDAKQAVKKAKKKGFNAKKLQALLSQKNEVAGTNKPSQELITSLFEHYKNGRFDDAEKMAISFTQQFPTHYFGWKILGVVFKETSEASKSLAAN